MIDTAVTVVAVLAAVGAAVATYQFTRIRIYLGPPWRSDAGTIFTEHVLLSAVWFVWFLGYFVSYRIFEIASSHRYWHELSLAVSIAVIFWMCVIRLHLWFRRRDDVEEDNE